MAQALDPRYAHLKCLDEPDYDEERVRLNESTANCVIVDGLPIVDDSKYDKLCALLTKKLVPFKLANKASGFVMPKDPSTGKTCGFGFCELENPSCAARCVAELNEKKLDKKHVLLVNLVDDAEKYQAVPEEYSPPDDAEFQDSVNMHDWLNDPVRDQFAIRYGNKTDVCWNDPARKGEPMEVVESREGWSDAFVQWSPAGTYLATVHKQGVQVWGGSQWTKLAKFAHDGVRSIQFSPCESFLITYNEQKGDKAIRVWDVRASKLLRAFAPKQATYAGEPGQGTVTTVRMPQFYWSHSGKYVARMTEKGVSVYQTPSMELCDNSSIKLQNVRGFSWSPSDDLLAYWLSENGDVPAKVVIVKWPTRELVAQKNLFNVCDANMIWHAQGDFLCVKVNRYTKSKKSTYTNFEIFRMRGRNYPVESIEIKDNVIDFAFEPRGQRFAVIHGTEPSCTVDMYTMGGVSNGKVVLENTVAKKPLNRVFWSPVGGILLVAGVKSLNGTLEWYEAETMERIGEGEHFMITDIAWDPTGRFVCTAVSSFRSALEAAYQIWTCSGTQVTRQTRENFFQLVWRPRPKSLVTDEMEAEIIRDLKDYAKRFDRADASAHQSALDDLKAEREEQRVEFADLCKKWYEKFSEDRKRRAEIRDGEMSDAEDDWEEIEVIDEELVKQKEDIIMLEK